MKRSAILLLTISLAALLFGGCGRQEEPSSDPLPTQPETVPTQVYTTGTPTLYTQDMAARLEAVFERYIEDNPCPDTYAGYDRPLGGNMILYVTDEATLETFRSVMDAAIPGEKAAWLRAAGVEPESALARQYDDYDFVRYVLQTYSLKQLKAVEQALRLRQGELEITTVSSALSDNRVVVRIRSEEQKQPILNALPEEQQGILPFDVRSEPALA